LSAAKAQASAPQTDALRSRTPHWSLPRNAAVDGLSGHHLVVRLDQEGRVIGHADLYRAPSGTEFDARSIESCLALAPHLAQALDVARTLSAAEACARRYAECREMRVFGCLLLDDAGSIMEMNSKARAWLAAEDGLSIADGRLRAQLVSDDRAVEAWLRKALAEQESCGEGHVAVSRPSGRRPYVLVMRRIDSPPPPFGVCRPRVQLLIVDADRGSDMPREVLQALYGLTRAETEMAWHLVNGASIGETAQRLGIAHATARHHLERIFAKTGACRQSDLVRLALAPFLLLSRGE
jgi:DNA-binding CsgD family transcriptional regulator